MVSASDCPAFIEAQDAKKDKYWVILKQYHLYTIIDFLFILLVLLNINFIYIFSVYI